MRFFYLFSPILFIGIFILGIILPLFIGVYVYNDADKRGMNPLLWLLIVVLVPGFIGFILYLILRSSTQLDKKCPNCNSYIDRGYDVCPNCLFPFENRDEIYNENTKKRNTLLIILLILILALPILIILGIVFFNFTNIKNYEEVVFQLRIMRNFMI
ncbi:MAG: hypothetical protein GX752_06765 [Clostridium sp.]|nr:hypothetical protein [Clostridium sp.]